MMPLEHQVTSLEISQRLQELGTKQNSLFSWFPRGTIEVHPFIALSSSQNNSLCSAYTVAELGEMLPNYYTTGRTDNNTYECWQIAREKEQIVFHHLAQITEADARGRMAIYLIENGLLKV